MLRHFVRQLQFVSFERKLRDNQGEFFFIIVKNQQSAFVIITRFFGRCNVLCFQEISFKYLTLIKTRTELKNSTAVVMCEFYINANEKRK